MIFGDKKEFPGDAGKHLNLEKRECPGRTFILKQLGYGGSYIQKVECETCHGEFSFVEDRLRDAA